MELSRRRTLELSGVAAVGATTALAGCGDDGPGDEESDEDVEGDDEQAEHPDEVDEEGGPGAEEDHEPTGGAPDADDEEEDDDDENEPYALEPLDHTYRIQ